MKTQTTPTKKISKQHVTTATSVIAKNTKFLSLGASALLGAGLWGTIPLQAQTETVVPIEYTSGMRNPLMGFREGQRSGTPGQKNLAAQAAGKIQDLSYHPYCLLIRDYIHYNVLENNAADSVQKIKNYSNEAWANYQTKNIKVIPRVILMYTADQSPPQEYWPSDLSNGDWTSQAVRDRVVNMVRKMGEAWNDDPRVAWVHMGLIGQWGEQESPVGIDEDLGGGVTWAKILEPVFKEAFPNKRVLVRSPEKWGSDYDVGMYWDTYAANGKMNDPVDEWGRVKYNNSPPREVFKKAPVEGEVAYGPNFAVPAQMGTDENSTLQNTNYRQFFKDTVRSVNGTTVGIEYDPKIAGIDQYATDVQKVFGYRFLLKEFTFTKRVERGALLDFSAKVVNDGSAPTYANWPLSLVLIDENSRQIVWTSPAVSGVDISQWLPGSNYDWNYVDGGFGTGTRKYLNPAPINQITGTVTIPSNMTAGSYLVGLSILDPTTMKPGIFFSTTNFLKASNSQPLGRIGIGANAGSGPITFDSYQFLNDTRSYNLTPVGSLVTVSATDSNAGESGDSGTFTFRRTGDAGTGAPLTVNYTVSGTAANGSDHQTLGGSVVIPAGQSSVTETVTVFDDTALEGSETVVVRLSSAATYTIGWPGESTVAIADDEPEPLPWSESFTYANGTAQNAGVPSWTVSPATVSHSVLNNQMSVSSIPSEAIFKSGVIDISSGAATVSLNVSGSGADLNEDYLRFYKKVDGGAEVLINSANGQPATSVWTHTINGGSRLELVVRSRINQKNENYKIDNLSVTLNGVPSLPVITVFTTDSIAAEPGDDGAFTVSRQGSTAAALTVNFAVSGTATSGQDYNSVGNSVTIPAGQSSAVVPVTVLNDSSVESSETVVLSLAGGTTYSVGTPNSATLTIADNDVPPPESLPWTETFTFADGTTSDSGPTSWSATPTTGGFRVLSNEMAFNHVGADGVFTSGAIDISSGPVTVSLNVRGGSGLDVGGDFLRFFTKVDGGPEVQVAAADGPQAAATWTANIASGSSLVLIVRARVTSTSEYYYFDDLSVTSGASALPLITVSATDAISAEPGDNGAFTVSRSGSTGSALIVNFSVGGTANAVQDYTALGTSVTIPAGQSTGVIPVAVVDDSSVESSETVVLTLASNAAYAIGTPNSATVTIADNDVLPLVTVTATDGSASEPGDNGQLTFTRTGSTSGALTVSYTVGGTANSASDYTALGTSVTIPAGQSTAVIPVAVVDDSSVESSETVVLTLASNAAYAIGTPNSATVTIADDDVAPVIPTVNLVTTNASEPNTSGTFTVSRTGDTTSALTVTFTVGGSATNGVDYNTLATSITIPAGQTSTVQALSISDDFTVEGSETVILTLVGNAAYSIGTPSNATANISDDETLPNPWLTADIGAVGAIGSASFGNSVWTLRGSGADIWNTADEFRYVYDSASGDCSIEARVTSLTNTNSWAKAAVMIRETTAANAQSAMVCITPTNGISFQYRASTGGTTVTKATVAGSFSPKYLRLTRTGNTFSAFRSDDKNTWTQVGGSQNINMSVNTTFGLALTSHADGTIGTCTMEEVNLQK